MSGRILKWLILVALALPLAGCILAVEDEPTSDPLIECTVTVVNPDALVEFTELFPTRRLVNPGTLLPRPR